MSGSHKTEKAFARRRLPPDESRKAALEAARDILINQGPQAVTLKSVASAIGRTHANLLHHFGSAYELQLALSRYICDRITALLERSMNEYRHCRDADHAADQISRFIYEAFDKEGGGRLAAWMITNGQPQAFHPVLEQINRLVTDMTEREDTPPDVRHRAVELTLLAFGYSILGPQLCEIMGLDKDIVRQGTRQMIADGLQERSAAITGNALATETSS